MGYPELQRAFNLCLSLSYSGNLISHFTWWGTLSSVCAWYSTVPDSSLLTTNKINILLLRPRLMLATERGSSETWWAAWPRVQPKGSVSALRGSCSQLEMVNGLLNCQNCVLLSKCMYPALKNRAKIFFS